MFFHCISLTGNREKNEDEIIALLNFNKETSNKLHDVNMFCVFDGHGGGELSKFLKDKYVDYLLNKRIIDKFNKSKTCNKSIVNIYNFIQKSIKDLHLPSRYCGSTALTCIIYGDSEITGAKIINLGDCRSIMCDKNNIAVPLSKDHKPLTYEENKRIKKLGGKIVLSKDDDPRIMGLSVSRGFGDLDCSPYISNIPDIYDYEIKKSKFIVLACDGLWDVLSNQEVVDFILTCLDNQNVSDNYKSKSSKNIAFKLANLALEKHSTDNLSVIILFF